MANAFMAGKVASATPTVAPQPKPGTPKARKILIAPVDREGLFTVPSEFTAVDEVIWAKRRMDTVRVSQYADPTCGLSNTYDPTGAYLCGGRKDGTSCQCNKFVEGGECLIRKKTVDDPHFQSCMYWETHNAGDPEGRYCPKGKFEDERINFGGTKSDEGFGCERCEYGQNHLPYPDSEGRTRWCSLKAHPVNDKSCCADNDPIDSDDESE